ncbi:hypothetical protein R2A130_2982 [Ahrensia sp. R2A130]|nr:hypothetical protein R2A130_2982 [Ahrensia sp. R2A130]
MKNLASGSRGVCITGCQRNGPLATCLTWLQADRPNHHKQ